VVVEDSESIPLVPPTTSRRDGRAVLRQVLPTGVIQVVRYLRAQRLAALASESWALSRVRRVEVQDVRARRDLDLAKALSPAHDVLWGRVSARIEEAGLRHNSGGINPGDRRALSALAAHLQPETVLEIGTHVGSSTVTLAATLDDIGSNITTVDITDVNDISVEPWKRYGVPCSPAEAVRGLAPVQFVVNSSLSYLAATAERYDLIFLDGDHSAATVYHELPLALSRLKPEGVMLIHDYFPHARRLWDRGELIVGPFLAVRRLAREGWPIDVVPLGELPWPTKLGRKVTSLAVVLGHSRGT